MEMLSPCNSSSRGKRSYRRVIFSFLMTVPSEMNFLWLDQLFFPIFLRRNAYHLFEDPRKIVRVIIAESLSDIHNIKIGGFQKLAGLLHLQINKKIHRSTAGIFLKAALI